jgi:hypothetical protein
VAANPRQVHPVEAEVEVALDVGAVRVRVLRDEHATLEVLGPHRAGDLLELERRADVGLRKPHPRVRPLRERGGDRRIPRRRPRQMQPDDARLRLGTAPHLAGPFGETL